MVTHAWDEAGLNLEAGRLCLEFANTKDWHASRQPVETLHTYADLAGWAVRVGLIGKTEAAGLRQAAARQPGRAQAALARARQLREALYRMFSALAAGGPAPSDDLAALNDALSRAGASLRLATAGGGFAWMWQHDPSDLDALMGPVARSAGDLLTSDLLGRVGECADDRGCGWLFLDTTRNHSRRWCGMSGCGNRAKARRHYARSRQAGQPA